MTNWSFGTVFEVVCAAVDPALPAVVCGSRSVSWGDFDRRTRSLAATFIAAGATPGDRIAHLMRNGPSYLETSVAGFLARLVHVNVNYRYTGDELFYILDNSGAAVIVFDAEFAPLIASLRNRLAARLYLQVGGEPADFAVDFDAAANAGATSGPQQHAPDDMLFIYTGGTTGLPKGVMWDQGTLAQLLAAGTNAPLPASLDELAAQVRDGIGRRRALVLPPLMHGTGYLTAIGVLARGGTVVLLPGATFDPIAAVEACAATGCDYAVVVGDAFARPLLKALDAGHGSIATVAMMISSGTMWSPEVKAGLLRHAPELMLVDALASSEVLGMGSAVQTRANAGAPTKFVSDASTIVVDDDLRPLAPGCGIMGRVARTGALPRGYWGDPEKSAKTFIVIDGVRYSMPGDFATVEADGSITLLGRGSQCINTAGEKVFPEEVEEALKTHPSVSDALVFGMPDPEWGQAVTAIVESDAATDTDTLDTDALRAHVRGALAGYKTPKRIIVVAKVPRAPNGKADYAAAKAMAA